MWTFVHVETCPALRPVGKYGNQEDIYFDLNLYVKIKPMAKTQQKRSFPCTVSCASSCVRQSKKTAKELCTAKSQQKHSKNTAKTQLFLFFLEQLFMFCVLLSCALQSKYKAKKPHKRSFFGSVFCAFSQSKSQQKRCKNAANTLIKL